MEANRPNPDPEADLPSSPEVPATAEPGDESQPTRYSVSTTAKPTVRLFNHGTSEPAHVGAVRSGSIRVGAVPKTERLLRAPALTPSVDFGWTRPVAARPFVTRSFSGLRIRSGGDQPPAPVPNPSDTTPDSAPASLDLSPDEDVNVS